MQTTVRNKVGAKIDGEAWAKIENPEMTVKEAIEVLKSRGNNVMAVGSRYTIVSDKDELLTVFASNIQEAKRKAKDYYPAHIESFTRNIKKIVKQDANRYIQIMDTQKEQTTVEHRQVYKCKFCHAFSKDLNKVLQHEKIHEVK